MSFKKATNNVVEDFTKGEQGEWTGSHSIVFLSDPQPGLCDMVENDGEGLVWDKEIDLMKKTVESINKISPTPKFICIGGDLINALPGINPEVRAGQVFAVKNEFSKLKPTIPIFCVSGNHDVGNKPNRSSIAWYKENFGDDYFTYWVCGVFYIVINSQVLYSPDSYPEHTAAQEKWMDEQLRLAKNNGSKHVVLFMHIPVFTVSADEGDHYFSLPTKIRGDFLRKLAAARIEKVFCGHYHRNAGGVWLSKDKTQKIECIVSSAVGAQLGNDQSGFNVVQINETEITHTYHTI